MIPRQRLVCSNRPVRQLADEGMDADLPAIGLILIPVIVVLVFAEQTVIGPYIAAQVWIVGAGGMY